MPAHANLVQNGSFEAGPAPGEAMQVAAGSTAIPGWVVTRDAIDYCGTRWNAAEGARSLALNGTNPGGIAQTFATVAGAEYEVRFFMAGDAFSSPILKHLRVEAAGEFQEFEFDAGHSWPWGMGWLEKTFAFTADGSSTTLEFYSLDAGETGPTLDSVKVEMTSTVGVGRDGATGLALAAPSPNPSRGAFLLAFDVPSETRLRLSVCDVRGRELRVLAEGVHAAGPHTRAWDGTTAQGPAPAGLYFIRLATPEATLVRKAVLSR